MTRPGKIEKVVVVTVLAAITLLLTYKLLVPGRLVYQGDLTSSDVTELNFPRRDLLSQSLKKGNIPVWTDLIGNGYPILGEGQTGIFYPPNLVLFGLLGPVGAYNLSVILSMVLAMAFMYLLARAIERSRTASVFAAVAFGAGAFFVARIRFMTLINAACWLPLVLYGIEKLYRTGKLRWAALSGIALAMQLLASWTQIFYITALLAICLLLFRFATQAMSVRKEKGAAWKTTRFWALALVLLLVVAVALAAIQLVPSMEGISLSNRAEGLSYQKATEFPLLPKQLAMFVLPYHWGNPAIATYNLEGGSIFWENCAFCGIITLILALFAIIWLIRREGEVAFWTGTLAISVLLALGSSTFVYHLAWSALPGMKLFRFPQRFLLIAVLALALLASRGLDRLTRKTGLLSQVIAVAAVVILVAELAVFAHTQVNTIDSTQLLTPPQTLELITGAEGTYRTGHLGQFEAWYSAYRLAGGWHGNMQPYINYRSMLDTDFNMVFGVQDIGAQGNYGVKRIKQLWYHTLDYRIIDPGLWTANVPESVLRVMGVQNVRYVLSSFTIDSPYLAMLGSLTFNNHQRRVIVYRNLLELPRAMVMKKYLVMKDPEKVPLEELFGPKGFGPEQRVLLEKKPPFFEKTGAASASIRRYESTRVEIEAETVGGGLLVLADTYYPGWKATVDGKPVKIMRANYAFRAVAVPDGKHRVLFSYSPGNYWLGIIVTLLATLVLLAWFLLGWRRDQRAATGAVSEETG